MKIYGIKSKEVMACPGSWALVAEAEVENDNGEEVYVLIQDYDGFNVVITKKSSYDYLVGDGKEWAEGEDVLEDYGSLKEAKESVYYGVIEKLRKVVKMLG